MKHTFVQILFIFRERGREGERERNTERLPPAHPQPGTWPTTQAYTLTRNRTCDLSVGGTMPSPLSHTTQGEAYVLITNYTPQKSYLQTVMIRVSGF